MPAKGSDQLWLHICGGRFNIVSVIGHISLANGFIPSVQRLSETPRGSPEQLRKTIQSLIQQSKFSTGTSNSCTILRALLEVCSP